MRLFTLPHALAGLFIFVMLGAQTATYFRGTEVTAVVDHVELRKHAKNGGAYCAYDFHFDLNGRRRDRHDSRTAPYRTGDTFTGRAMIIAGQDVFLPTGWSLKVDGLQTLGLAIVWNGFMSFFIYFAWIGPMRRRWLVRDGEATVGRITELTAGRGRGSSNKVAYEFEVNGRTVSGKSKIGTPELRAAVVGQPITVIYDPNKPKRSVPYELSDFIVSDAAMG